MGLFSWGKKKSAGSTSPGPDADGVYSQIPKNAKWGLGPDPAGDPLKFVPGPGDLYFDVVDWGWGDVLKSAALIKSPDGLMGFGFIFELSDGTLRDRVEVQSLAHLTGKADDRKEIEWQIPKGHPTRRAYLASLGEPTTNLVRFVEKCFGLAGTALPAIPEKSGVSCIFVILRGRIVPQAGLFTARCKIFLGADGTDGDDKYAEFFLNLNSVTKKIWLSQKAAAYQGPIIRWMTGQAGLAQ
jgi:hypothetical protein